MIPEIPASTPADPNRPKTRTEVKPLSILDFAPFSILIFDRAIFIPVEENRDEVRHEIMIQVRRTVRDVYDDPTSIPLTAVPALALALEEIAKGAMVLTPTEQPAAAPKQPNKKKRK